MDDIDIHLRFENDPWLSPQREHDTFIMETFSNLPGVTGNELLHAQ